MKVLLVEAVEAVEAEAAGGPRPASQTQASGHKY